MAKLPESRMKNIILCQPRAEPVVSYFNKKESFYLPMKKNGRQDVGSSCAQSGTIRTNGSACMPTLRIWWQGAA